MKQGIYTITENRPLTADVWEMRLSGDTSPLTAPGQFINELVSGGFTGTETSPEAAVAYAEERMKKNTWVSLGGWGGYIVVGFDHSIDNSSSGYKGGYNFSITGNAFKGSSEPGIVYVMQDTNGNTLPDDEWYELKGSEYGKEETVQDYAVTYEAFASNVPPSVVVVPR